MDIINLDVILQRINLSFLSLLFRHNRWISEEMPTSFSFKHGNIDIRGGFWVSSARAPPSVSHFRSWSNRPEHTGSSSTPWRQNIVEN